MVTLIVTPGPKLFLATEVGFLGGTMCWTVSPDLRQSAQLLSGQLLHTATDVKLCCWKVLQGNLGSVHFLRFLGPRSQCPAGLGRLPPLELTRPAENLAVDSSPRSMTAASGCGRQLGTAGLVLQASQPTAQH